MDDLFAVLEPPWQSTEEHTRVDLLAEVIILDPKQQRHLIRTALHRKLLTVSGDIHPTAIAVTILGGAYRKGQHGYHVHIDDQASVLNHPMPSTDDYSAVIETCAGIGGIGEGAHAAGFFIAAMNDKQEEFSKFTQRQQYDYTVTGDISDNRTLVEIHSMRSSTSVLTAGFPCQPWSALGDQRGSADGRAMTLLYIFRAAWFLRSHGLLLECVPQAKDDPKVKSLLAQWCRLTHSTKSDVTLELSQVWPSRRHRWWCLLTSCGMVSPTLHPFPRLPKHPVVGDVLPVFPRWPVEELGQLTLGQYETSQFEQCGGLARNMIRSDQPLPTALHGWANQLDPCPCKCRQGPMSYQRLHQKGLFGALVDVEGSHTIQGHQVPKTRHIHPWELATLLGMYPGKTWMPSLKLSICGLGQLASPLQASWIASQYRFANKESFPQPVLTPEEVLWNQCTRIFAARDTMLPAIADYPQVAQFQDTLHGMLHTMANHRSVPPAIPAPESSGASFYALWMSVVAFRRYADPSVTYPIMDSLFRDGRDPSHQTPGPCQALAERLTEIGWTWYQDGWFFDHDRLAIHVLDSPVHLLKQRIQQAWRARVLAIAAQRPSMEGLQHADVDFTMQGVHSKSEEDQGILRLVFNGAFYTRDRLCRSGTVDSGQCPWCPHQDSVYHRHFECPALEHCRTTPVDTSALPPCTLNHGWFQEPAAVPSLRTHLCQLPDTSCEWALSTPDMAVLHLFTDGSCLEPREPRLRLATWACVCANLEADTFVPLSRGAVPGLLQTATRAEATAAISAVAFALHHRKPFIIWLDNAKVFKTLEAFRCGKPPSSRMHKDHDLWHRLWSLVTEANAQQLFIRAVKVRAHESHAATTDPVELWALQGNEAADAEALAARRDLPGPLLASWGLVADEHAAQVAIKAALHARYIEVGKWAISHGSTDSAEPSPDAAQDLADHAASESQPAEDPDLHPILVPMPAWDTRKPNVDLGAYGSIVFDWLLSLTNQPATGTFWFTTYQILILFQRETGRIGPARRGTTKFWYSGEDHWTDLAAFCFLQQAKWMGQFIKWIGILFGQTLVKFYRRPAGSSLRGWHQCYPLQLSSAQVARVDLDILQCNSGEPVANVQQSLGQFPMFHR
eukprot:Skav217501  [mRNA]  locus=scaffold1908:258586:268404:+ [translate_table: standard]